MTAHGRRLLELTLPPRLGEMVLQSVAIGAGRTAVVLAALLQERDPFRGGEGTSRDLDRPLQALLQLEQRSGAALPLGFDVALGRRILQSGAELWQRLQGWMEREGEMDVAHAGLLLSYAYPDRLARRRLEGEGRYRLASGTEAQLPHSDPLTAAEWLVVADLDRQPERVRIRRAAAVAWADLERFRGDLMTVEREVSWNPTTARVEARQRRKLGAILCHEQPLLSPDPAEIGRALLEGVRSLGLEALPWSEAALRLRQRIGFLQAAAPINLPDRPLDLPDLSSEWLCAHLEVWLLPFLTGISSLKECQRLDLLAILRGQLNWSQQQLIDRLAPERLELPTGSHLAIDYSDPQQPKLAVRLQELLGVAVTPAVLEGRVPLLLQLLSPAQRPIQQTCDLLGFWRGSYAEVRKEMRGRYPKHPWPEDPLTATPTRLTKRRSEAGG